MSILYHSSLIPLHYLSLLDTVVGLIFVCFAFLFLWGPYPIVLRIYSWLKIYSGIPSGGIQWTNAREETCVSSECMTSPLNSALSLWTLRFFAFVFYMQFFATWLSNCILHLTDWFFSLHDNQHLNNYNKIVPLNKWGTNMTPSGNFKNKFFHLYSWIDKLGSIKYISQQWKCAFSVDLLKPVICYKPSIILELLLGLYSNFFFNPCLTLITLRATHSKSLLAYWWSKLSFYNQHYLQHYTSWDQMLCLGL